MEEKGSKIEVRTSLEHFNGIERIKIIPHYTIGKIHAAVSCQKNLPVP